MPVYEYRCTQCHKIFEYQQRMADAAKTVCEECSGALERLISRSSFALKGDGWYKDLYSSAKPAADAKPAEKTSTTVPSAPSSSSDSGGSTSAPASTPSSGGGSSGGSGGSGGGSTPAASS